MRVRGYYKGVQLWSTEATLETVFSTVLHVRDMARSMGLAITLAVEDESGVVHLMTPDGRR